MVPVSAPVSPVVRAVPVSPPAANGFTRAQALAAFQECLAALERLETANETVVSPRVAAVLALRDRLELYLETAPPGEPYAAGPGDAAAASMAADILEGP